MFTIKTDDLTHPAVQALVAYHISGMLQQSPPESSHALDVQKLRNPTVTFWSVWESEQLAGIGALKLLDDKHGELKSMRTAPNYLRRGVASLILRHILQVAHDRCLHRLSLETGTQAGFTACHHLYLKHGFVDCEPFADYQFDPHNRFLSLTLCENNELP
ncbi:GNAT family N-acetyltransferase [Escherichia coli]|nr:GNAT family N-acetyltransferase [Escherichia coli]EFD4960503.1 GNAT family N-acetyltransferase [Escherichia coli]EGF7347621.1 GNAT family N-acetyltransferase [Escherichia coli]EGF7412559.1 GNAT family N-acetyltransferase [Escherichia coli]EGF7453708.1 GNAT family N-acetyltransferase [Escherichia coli]